MYRKKIAEDLDCGITVAMKVLGGKWKFCIIDAISRGIDRPSQLHRQIEAATPRVLDMQLRELELDGIVIRKAATGFPLKTEYQLTALGETILPIIQQMNSWGETNKERIKQSVRSNALAVQIDSN